ncbi:MAG: hypothetical protein ACTSXH_13045 [Promethearchaeota archaeon]
MKKIFIISNDDFACKIYNILMNIEGHKIIGCENDVAKAINHLSSIEQALDIIIIDYRMSNREALSLLHSLTQICQNLKIIWINPNKIIKEFASEVKSLFLIEEPCNTQELIFFINDASQVGKNLYKVS